MQDPHIPSGALVYEWVGEALKAVDAQVTDGQIVLIVDKSEKYLILTQPLKELPNQ